MSHSSAALDAISAHDVDKTVLATRRALHWSSIPWGTRGCMRVVRGSEAEGRNQHQDKEQRVVDHSGNARKKKRVARGTVDHSEVGSSVPKKTIAKVGACIKSSFVPPNMEK